MNSPDNKSLARRMKLILWKEHQPYIAFLLICCLIGMGSYFWYRSIISNGIIDIDHAQPITAEFQIDVNSAEWSEIVVLPGVGEKLARAIVDHRQEVGPFKSLDAIQDVPGIGEKKLHQLRPFLLPINLLPSQTPRMAQ